jgi:hypothetical protein
MDVELLSFGVTHRLFLKYGLLENSSCILVLSLFMILPFYKPSISSGISRLATFDCQMVDLWISYYYPIILPIKAVYIYIHIDRIINPPCIGLKWDWINVQLHEFDFPHGDLGQEQVCLEEPRGPGLGFMDRSGCETDRIFHSSS